MIPPILNGGWQLSPGHGTDLADEARQLDGWSRLVEAGFNTFDVADIYTGVERRVGKLIARHAPGAVRVHTKCVPDRSRLPNLRKADLTETIDRSLDRLGVEQIDRVQFHWWDFETDGWLEAYGWLHELQAAGKIAELAVTNFDLTRLTRLVDAGLPVVSHQLQYSILDRRPAGAMAEYCLANKIQMLCYGSLAGGLLGGRYQEVERPDAKSVNRSLVKYLLIVDECGGWEPFQRRLAQLRTIADRHQRSVANVATRWLLDQPGVTAAIIGAADDRWLESNLRTLDFELSDDERQQLSAGPTLHGEVYGLERERGSRHAEIMRYELNRRDD